MKNHLYILGIMMHPKQCRSANADCINEAREGEWSLLPLGVVIHCGETLGQKHKNVPPRSIDDPARAAKIMKQAMPDVRSHRKETGDTFYSFS